MENLSFWAILGLAITVACGHTLAGPDHYLPFIVLAKSRGWTLRRTLGLTLVCGIGHLASAILLAILFSLFAGWLSPEHHELLEGSRGNLAAWMLTVLGGIYMIWGIRQAIRNRSHSHAHLHEGGVVHSHTHTNFDTHAHPHTVGGHGFWLGWSLFVILVLGPCEAMLPLLAAAAIIGRGCLFATTVLFSATTLVSMLVAVTIGYYGMRQLAMPFVERWMHVFAGMVLAACGLSVLFLGL